MKASVEWLKEFSNINVDTKTLGDILTMSGSKVEGIESRGNDIKNVVVGKILEIEKHPNADKLVVTKVDVGTEKLQIVTGADNIRVGDIVPIAKDGSELPGNVKIKKGKLRDVDSCGMMCSVQELGLELSRFPGQIEHGIMILPKELESKLGEDIVDVLNLREDIIEFEITSNRPDCLSIEGLGRETAASLNEEFKNPRKNLDDLKIKEVNEIEGLKVDITAPDLCYRYVARVVKDVKIEPSPEWMTRRLNACGVRSINNIVDITNYVMLEMGQPMHAFDINSIEGKHITVRRAKDGEKITTLDEQERNLNSNMLVISDEKKAVAIAGVMGGLNSEIEDTTKTVVFESAVFNGGSVRKTAKAVGLRTEASSRYEKGLSAENAKRAIDRACELCKILNVGNVVEERIDVYPTKQVMNRVKWNKDSINALLGTDISREEMIKIFEKVDLKVEGDYVISPYFRVDIEREADLAEEVARFYGYDKLGSTLVAGKATIGVKTKKQKIEDNIKTLLTDKGLSEICTYGFINEDDLDKMNLPNDSEFRKEVIKIRNPLSQDYTIMRPSSVPSMMQIISGNMAKKNKNVGVYDISRIYRNVDGQIEKGTNPTEEKIITIGMYGNNVDFYVLKGLVESVLQEACVLKYDIFSESENASYHPGRTAKLTVGKDKIATLGEIHPRVLNSYDCNEKVYVAEISLDKIEKYSREVKKYVEVPKYPAVERDISLTIDEDVEVLSIEKVIYKKSKKILEEVKLFDVYRNEKLGENKKSVAFELKFRSKDRTLTDEEINEAMEEILKELENTFHANLRK